MSFKRFLMGNIRNRMLQACVTLVRGLTCLKKICKTLGYMEIIVFKIPSSGRGAKPYLSHGLRNKPKNQAMFTKSTISGLNYSKSS